MNQAVSYSNPYSEWLCNYFPRRQGWAWCPVSRVGRGGDRGHGGAAESRQGRGGLRPDAAEHLSISRELLALAEGLCPSQTGFLSSPLQETLSFSTVLLPKPQRSVRRVLCCTIGPEDFPGTRVAASLQTFHLGPHRVTPPASSHQQIQLTNLMLQLQKAKQSWMQPRCLGTHSRGAEGGRTVWAEAGAPPPAPHGCSSRFNCSGLGPGL